MNGTETHQSSFIQEAPEKTAEVQRHKQTNKNVFSASGLFEPDWIKCSEGEGIKPEDIQSDVEQFIALQ